MPPIRSATQDAQWHLDKKVPISLIATILIQTFAGIWWASSLNEKVSQHDRQIITLLAPDVSTTQELRRVSELLSRVEERMAATMALMARVEQAIERAQSRPIER